MDPKVIRAPSLKRGKNDGGLNERIKLKKVLGLTVCSNAALDVSPTTGVLAYPAGCTVVLFNSKKLSQQYLLNTSRKAITAIAYSRCGRYVATGECGQNPAIKVWELDATASGCGGSVVAEFAGHKYAISCIAFSPTGKYLVSVGSQHDMIVNVFDWKCNLKIASNKVSAKVVAVCFSEDGSYFVTVGNRHVKYWYLEGNRKYKEPIPLMGRSAILGELRNNDFCAVACSKDESSDSTYAITRNGHLVEFNSRRLLDKWVACRTTLANCLCTSSKYILVGCAESIIRVFNAKNLEYLTTLPRTHYLGVDVAQGVHINHITAVPQMSKFPDTIAMVYDEPRSKVSCVYNDHSLYIWDLRDIQRVGKSHSFLYHSACIWGVETVPYNYLKNNLPNNLPLDCFLTCSSDDTIRVWALDDACENNEIYRKNIYSKELLKLMYIDDELNFIKDIDNPILNMEKPSSYDGRNGVRCIKISPDRLHLATGDRSGNIRIYNLGNLKIITTIEAHDSEVLCLEYTNDKIERKMLASASRDRLIHIFEVDNGYQILQTLDDHSSSITSVKFIGAGSVFQMVSCGADKSIIFRTFQQNQFLRGNNCSGKNTLYDMEIDSNSKHILTACQDRNIRIYGTQNAKHTKTFKGSHSDEGSLIKLSLDQSGIYIATSCTDKTLSVYDYYSTECMARMYGHSELVTGLKFTNDCKHLISASGDGCIFIWQVPHDMIVTMQARLSQQALRSGHPAIARPLSTATEPGEVFGSPAANFLSEDVPSSPGYRFSDVGQLPQWAKKKAVTTTADDASPPQSSNVLSSSPSQSQLFGTNPKPRGRWAQKATFEPDALELRNSVPESPSSYNTATSPPLPAPATSSIPISASSHHSNLQTSDYNSGSSKDVYNNTYLSEDSSIDSGMENRRDLKFLSKEQKNLNAIHFESNTEHDGDVEDISDGERTSSDHGMMFYPPIAPGTPTDFKVMAMNEDELRKSVRRQKFERQGLQLSSPMSPSGPSTGTGTGTSDDDDEGSTPSGDNAERSLASTLGGSSESIAQQSSSSFLQAALDGPGSLSDRGERSRRSISAKHNGDNKPSSYSKSYSSTKKDELMKVINEAKQKLENVGYRSNLRASHSIADLSHAGNIDARTGRLMRTGDTNNYCHYNNNKGYAYLNCAAPKAILTQNCNIIRQLQHDYPPYPCDIGLYNNSSSIRNNSSAIPQTSVTTSITTPTSSSSSSSCVSTVQLRPNTLEIPLFDKSNSPAILPKGQKHPSILKHYKSCPVSPVHEELDWSNLPTAQNSAILLNESATNKRHSMYSEDAKTILDMIHIDTEKMIAEITQKYGDLDDFTPSAEATVPMSILTEKPKTMPKSSSAVDLVQLKKSKDLLQNVDIKEHGFLSDEEGSNFSSDSLEDCSLDLDLNDINCGGSEQIQRKRRKANKATCHKHTKNKLETNPNLTMPTRSVSDYFIYDQFFFNKYRNISLSDILNEPADTTDKERLFLNTQRHSSASFFLGLNPDEKKSQESLLSDDFGGVSYCNSMESILSDESECKSAPLEALFLRSKLELKTATNQAAGNLYDNKIDSSSKSYGSSPNATSGFDYYMQQDNREQVYDLSGYESLLDNRRTASNVDSCQTAFSSSHKQSAFISGLTNQMTSSQTYPRLQQFTATEECIPRLTSKNHQYQSSVNKSLSKEFADHRHTNNSNPIFGCTEKSLPANKPTAKLLTNRLDIFSDPSVYVMKKSCSFDIEMFDGRRTQRSTKKYEQNLEKFEKERKMSCQFGGTLGMDYVPHKPPVANRRSSSVKNKRNFRDKERYHTVGQINCEKRRSEVTLDLANDKKCYQKSDEKSFEIYIAEKGSAEDDNMDSLEAYDTSKLHKENSMDSLDDLSTSKDAESSIGNADFLTQAEYLKFRDIEKKIDIINKLVEMEERKLEQERILKENRMQPFRCNSKEKGYVKSLTMNFDKLAKTMQEASSDWDGRGVGDCSKLGKIKRNFSLPDVLEGAKFQLFSCDNDSDGIFDKLMTEGNPKSLMSAAQIDDSSSIRRACSLSDLSMVKGSKPSNNLSYKPVPSNRQSVPNRVLPKRSGSSVGKTPSSSSTSSSSSNGMGLRSISVGTLNQASDSDPEGVNSRGGVLRPTISSQNKTNGGTPPVKQYNNSSKTAAGIINRRRGLTNAYSSVNLSTAGQDDSSSEEAQSNPPLTNGKPAIPPRPRSISVDHKRNGGLMPGGIMIGGSMKSNIKGNNGNLDDKDVDVDNADLTSQLCSKIISQLMVTTTSVMQLHQRLKHSDESSGARHKNLMLRELENAVIMTQSMLTKVTNNRSSNDNTNGGSNSGLHVTFNTNDSNRSASQNGELFDKCSDMLQKVQKQKQNT